MDLFVANIDHEFFSLYRNNKDETFDDVAMPHGIGAATRMMSGWGLKFFDYDNDGNLDLFLANGNPDDLIEVDFIPGYISRAAHPFAQYGQGVSECQRTKWADICERRFRRGAGHWRFR